MPSLWKWSVTGCVSDILVNMCHWNQLGGRAAHLSREGRGCSHSQADWLNLTCSKRHELSDCNWEISCFLRGQLRDHSVAWMQGKCMHSMPRKDLDWEGNFVAFLWELKSCLFPFPMTRLCWDRICLSLLCTKKNPVRTRFQETGGYLCPGLQSPVFQCVSTRCEREDICGCASFTDINSPFFLMDCKMKLMMTPLALGNWHVCECCAGAL